MEECRNLTRKLKKPLCEQEINLYVLNHWDYRSCLLSLECRSRKSRNTWSNSQIWTWSTEWSRAKANRDLPRQCSGHSKHPLPTTQEKTTHEHHQMVNTEIRLIIFFAAKDGEALYSQQKQGWRLTVAQIMNSLLSSADLNWRKQGKPLDHSGMT